MDVTIVLHDVRYLSAYHSFRYKKCSSNIDNNNSELVFYLDLVYCNISKDSGQLLCINRLVQGNQLLTAFFESIIIEYR